MMETDEIGGQANKDVEDSKIAGAQANKEIENSKVAGAQANDEHKILEYDPDESGAQANNENDLLDYDPDESGAQANEAMKDGNNNGIQAIDEEILDYEPDEEEVPSLSQILERNGGQARKYSKIRSGIPRCNICSQQHLLGYDTLEIHHNHFSNKQAVISSITPANNPNFRLKICVSDSPLHEHWDDEMIATAGGNFQVCWLSIPGARINELITAWEVEYRDEMIPMDVMLLGGVFNVAKGSAGPNILNAMSHFVDLVRIQGERLHPASPNTCAIAPMSYPPSLCWFQDDGPVADNFWNHLRNMRWLNQRIESLNLESGIKAPNFATLGVRKDSRFGQSTTRHRMKQWQGASRREKLALSADFQIKKCRQICRYFLHNTGDERPSI